MPDDQNSFRFACQYKYVFHIISPYIYGETATYKTSVAKFFTVWRREWKSKPIISMESTREAREQEIFPDITNCSRNFFNHAA